MTDETPYTLDLTILNLWIDAAMSKGGTRTEVPGRVSSSILNAARSHPESLISGVPNRVFGYQIWWYADVRHDTRRITIMHIDPAPHPGL